MTEHTLDSRAARPDPSLLAAEPGRRLAILTCMDARVDPYGICDLDLGDAHILRNAGGRATPDMIRSLTLSTHILGVRALWVIHHTDCGLAKMSQTAIVDRVRLATGSDTRHVDYHAIDAEPEAVVEDVEILRRQPALPAGIKIQGFIYDIHTDELVPVTSIRTPVLPAASKRAVSA